jgi:N-acetylglucosaminyldiphosphoundecaprenol N-acetyl-beta-D-mannosaminyltransferase
MMVGQSENAGRAKVPFVRIVGTPVSIVSLEETLRFFESWVKQRRGGFAVFRDVHGVTRAEHDAKLQKAHENANLIAPDGMPLVWVAKLAGIKGMSRVAGPDVLPAVCERGLAQGWRHYFFGSAPGVAQTIAKELAKAFPGIIIAGMQSPPFRDLTEEENELACTAIREARPHFVWVGLGTPKQEIWMDEHWHKCGGAILLGVGAAFDIFARNTPRAPKWMQESGLEWLFRLIQEPKRLWRRYLVSVPTFICSATVELLRGEIKASDEKRNLETNH